MLFPLAFMTTVGSLANWTSVAVTYVIRGFLPIKISLPFLLPVSYLPFDINYYAGIQAYNNISISYLWEYPNLFCHYYFKLFLFSSSRISITLSGLLIILSLIPLSAIS